MFSPLKVAPILLLKLFIVASPCFAIALLVDIMTNDPPAPVTEGLLLLFCILTEV